MRAILYLRTLFNTNQPKEEVRLEAYREISESLNKAFTLPSLNNYSKSLSMKGLLTKSVEMFVGSRMIPKNLELSRHLIKIAERKAKTQSEKSEVDYYKYFFLRIDAFKNNKKEEFDLSTEMINKLAEEKGHPQSCYLVGKQLFNVASSTQDKKQKKELIKLAAYYFDKSVSQDQCGGLFYLGQIFRNQEYAEMDDSEVKEFFILGAALGDPLCYFKMSQIYLMKQREKLYLKYLKMAAEAGVIEAQHNLGCEYLDGKRMPKDEVKALAWFLHASANGFIESKYNVVYLFTNGSECGRIKVNKEAALLKLEQLKDMGEEVDSRIAELIQNMKQGPQKL